MFKKLKKHYARLTESLAARLKGSFYLYLALAFSLLVLADATVLHVGANLKQKAFDLMVQHRVAVPEPDPDIVIVDINEASLAALAPDYGRWPWPRQVLGEFLENLEKQQPRAVVFDILFSDADVYNADSDVYFNEAIAATDNTFFPMLRLDASSDKLSQLKISQVPGAKAREDGADPNATVAMVLPYFQAAVASGRLGLHNIVPDKDGIVREYQAYRVDHGWQLPSLPLKVAQALGASPTGDQGFLLNWRGKPFTYRYVSFGEVYNDMLSKEKKRPAGEFANKIVIIGSTAPSLFDLKATAIDKQHPGVEILATAIDNLHRGDYLRLPRSPLGYFLTSLAIVWLTALAFFRNLAREKVDRIFGASQFILLGVSYASINLTQTYVDLTAPVTIAFAYFSIARLYAYATDRALQHSFAEIVPRHGDGLRMALLLIDTGHDEAETAKLAKRIERHPGAQATVAVMKGSQRGLWGLFEGMIAITWRHDTRDAQARVRIEADRAWMREQAADCLQVFEDTVLPPGAPAGPGWRSLLARALAKLESSSESHAETRKQGALS